jgi:protein-S-isoprenylcysteine O-methyltransferase Ste14
MNKRLLARFAARESMGILFMAVALFWAAGTTQWWQAWALLAITSGWVVATAVVIARHHPALFAERLGPRKGAKRWDTALMSVHGVLQLTTYVIAALDHRYGWTVGVPAGVQLAAMLVGAVGYALVVWATASNAFFSQIVHVQTERGHSVVSSGPYAFVRHPAYAGGFLTNLSAPILLGSTWALILGSVDALLMILRAALEDRTLKAELPGYLEYTTRVRYRLLRSIW